MKNLIQEGLDIFLQIRHWTMCAISYVSMRIYSVKVTFDDVKRGAYKTEVSDLNLDSLQDPDIILSQVKELLKQSGERRAYINDKVKTLIGINAAILALIGLFVQKSTDFNNPVLAIIFIVGVAFIFNAILNLWNYFDLKIETNLTVDQGEIGLGQLDLKKSIINDYRFVSIKNDDTTEFLADLYKTSRFFMLSGFLFLLTCYSVSYFSKGKIERRDGDRNSVEKKEANSWQVAALEFPDFSLVCGQA